MTIQYKKLSQAQVLLMAAAAGISVANIYYVQPILKYISRDFHVVDAQAGSLSMLAQVGYGLGLFFLIPLGDKLSRKNLSLILLLLLALTSTGIAFTHSFPLLMLLSVLIGIFSVTPQILIPLAAFINADTRGKTVGTILSGLLIGILGARVLSGWVATHWGWTMIYKISAVLCLVLFLLLKKSMPDVPSTFSGNYASLLKSTVLQIKKHALLREASLMGALLFGTFCSFWTTITFYLSDSPFNYNSEKIGLFGLVAITGAMMAPLVGRIADKGKVRLALKISAVMTLASAFIFKFFPTSLLGLIVGIVLLDVGVQGAQVSNAARIYGLDKESGSRINTVYMTSYFLGGASGTAVGLYCWSSGGWSMVTMQMIIWSMLALATIIIGGRLLSNHKTNKNEKGK
ncbi:MAG: MFS transporter [Pseudopedobacter saltans]|uniref:MFS transporter n=1 Tax=Pseudopedobacter saltans TaxID=151895 RepID=A0A2W5F5T9_9SPHI|nr:MAG: MFS transporter [Pseudopedobacter saltans]